MPAMYGFARQLAVSPVKPAHLRSVDPATAPADGPETLGRAHREVLTGHWDEVVSRLGPGVLEWDGAWQC
jgi:hypothetical protein